MFPGGMNPRQMSGMMKQLGIKNTEVEAEEVIIKLKNGKTIKILEPQVQLIEMKGVKTYSLAGKEVEEEGYPDEDVKMVAEQANVSEEEAKKHVIKFDIQKTDELLFGNWTEETKKLYGDINHPDVIKKGMRGLVGNKEVDVIIGGPPCQAYSLAGRAQDPNSMKNDYRNYLFESFVKVVEEFKPKVFVFENVPLTNI